MAPPKSGHPLGIPPDSGSILRECPLLGGVICLDVVSRVEKLQIRSNVDKEATDEIETFVQGVMWWPDQVCHDFTLHPAPCTLHPAPCTLHPAPCAMHPDVCSRRHGLAGPGLQQLSRNVKRFRGGLVFKAHGPLYHSTLGSRVSKKKEKKKKSLTISWKRSSKLQPSFWYKY